MHFLRLKSKRLCYNSSELLEGLMKKNLFFEYKLAMKHSKLDYLIKLTYDRSYKGYVAEVVNLYGCMSQGKTKEEALENAEKAIKAYMEALKLTSSKNSSYTTKSVDTPLPSLNA